MQVLINSLIVLGVFLFMEFMAWFTHKYVMHGWGWFLHEDHHVIGENKIFFEKNDSFFIIFAIPSFFLFLFGALNGYNFLFWIGAGIALYGAAYFFVHDLFIHQRIKVLTRTKNPYFMALRKAHKVHHKHQGKEDGECFGMLFVPMKYWRDAKKSVSH